MDIPELPSNVLGHIARKLPVSKAMLACKPMSNVNRFKMDNLTKQVDPFVDAIIEICKVAEKGFDFEIQIVNINKLLRNKNHLNQEWVIDPEELWINIESGVLKIQWDIKNEVVPQCQERLAKFSLADPIKYQHWDFSEYTVDINHLTSLNNQELLRKAVKRAVLDFYKMYEDFKKSNGSVIPIVSGNMLEYNYPIMFRVNCMNVGDHDYNTVNETMKKLAKTLNLYLYDNDVNIKKEENPYGWSKEGDYYVINSNAFEMRYITLGIWSSKGWDNKTFDSKLQNLIIKPEFIADNAIQLMGGRCKNKKLKNI